MKGLSFSILAFCLSINSGWSQDLNLDLVTALDAKDTKKVKELIAQGASLKSDRVKDSLVGLTSYAAATTKLEETDKNLDKVVFYVSQGVDINSLSVTSSSDPFTSIGNTPLTDAVSKTCTPNKLRTIAKILALGADPELTNEKNYKSGGVDRWTPLNLNRQLGFSWGPAACHLQVENLLLSAINDQTKGKNYGISVSNTQREIIPEKTEESKSSGKSSSQSVTDQ